MLGAPGAISTYKREMDADCSAAMGVINMAVNGPRPLPLIHPDSPDNVVGWTMVFLSVASMYSTFKVFSGSASFAGIERLSHPPTFIHKPILSEWWKKCWLRHSDGLRCLLRRR